MDTVQVNFDLSQFSDLLVEKTMPIVTIEETDDPVNEEKALLPYEDSDDHKVNFDDNGVSSVIIYRYGIPFSNGMANRAAFFIGLSYFIMNTVQTKTFRTCDMKFYYDQNVDRLGFMNYQSLYQVARMEFSEGHGIFRIPTYDEICHLISDEKHSNRRSTGRHRPTEAAPSAKKGLRISQERMAAMSKLAGSNQRAIQIMLLLMSAMDGDHQVKINNKRLGTLIDLAPSTAGNAVTMLKNEGFISEVRKTKEEGEYFYTFQVNV